MVSLKLPLFKQKIARKPSAKSSQSRVNSVSLQRKVSCHKKARPTVISTLRASSTVQRLTAGRSRQLGFITVPPCQPSQKRRIIHVATLNYGPFEDDEFTIPTTYIPRPFPLKSTQTEAIQKNFGSGETLPAAIPQSHVEDTATEPIDPIGDMTLPSVYSRESWIEVEHPTTPAIVVWRAADPAEDEEAV